MTIYNISVITSTGYPYYNKEIASLPKGLKLYLRFFDFTENPDAHATIEDLKTSQNFELNAGLISALFEFARCMDKKILSLEFKSKKEEELKEFLQKDKESVYEGDVLITVQTETYLFYRAVKEKIEYIYKNVFSSKIPLESSEPLSKKDEEEIIDVLNDAKASDHVLKFQKEIKGLGEDLLKEMKNYGLNNIVITSFDLSPLIVFGEKYSFKDIEVLLRNTGEIPQIPPLEWAYRLSFIGTEQVWVYIVNSGIGVTLEGGLFESFYYVLLTDAQSYLGEFPAKLTSEFNLILG